MKQYESYKDSGVEWIGEVPSHWEVMPLKFTGTFGNGLTYSPKDVVDNGILVLRSSNIQNSSLSFDNNVYVSSVSKELLVNKGDIIICSRNGSAALVGKSAFIEMDINATFGAFMMRYIPNINKKYGFYLFQTAIGRYKGYFATTTINQLTKSTIGEMKVPLANIEEQQKIVSYLDKKCSEIDKVISAQQKRIALLQELKQSVITHTVTKGLNPNVEMKDSGVEWIGHIPSNWEIKPLKYMAVLSPKISACDINENIVSYVPMENVRNDELKEDEISIAELSSGLNSFSKGDILMAKVTPCFENGNIAIANNISHNIGFCSSELFVIRGKNVNRRYLFYTLQNEDYKQRCTSTLTGTGGLKRVSGHFVRNCMMPVPSKNEQDNIVSYLDEKCASLNSSIFKAQHQVELLQEYKQSLITEVVTGKRKVS